MSKRILWLEDDGAWIKSYYDELVAAGYNVTHVRTVTDAEDALRSETYDLLIMDVMLPTTSAEEQASYPVEATQTGEVTGLVFYRRVKELLARSKTRVLVLTIRLDAATQEAFLAEGLDRLSYMTRVALRTVEAFVMKVRNVLGEADVNVGRPE